jgi:uncharacterized protein
LRILAVSDLHGHLAKYKLVIKRAVEQKVQAVVLAGDLLPGRSPLIAVQKQFCYELFHVMKELASHNIHTVYVMGNDDLAFTDGILYNYVEGNPFTHLVDHRVAEVCGYLFTGMSEVKDLPYALKDRARLDYSHDSSYQIIQPSKVMLTVPHAEFGGEWVEMTIEKFLVDYLPYQKSLARILWSLPVEFWYKTVLVTHDPPKGVGLDITGGGESVGSKAVLDFIDDVQPLVSIHGHIHESPNLTGIWKTKIGRTLSVQAGQSYHGLFYSLINLETLEAERFTEILP